MSNTKPTRAGWWWRKLNNPLCPPWPSEVGDEDGELYLADSYGLVEDDGTWLAPIPSPAVCAAVARWADALAMPPSTRRKIAVDAALAELCAAVSAEQGEVTV